MAVHNLLLVFAALLLGLGAYFVATDNLALGAAMFAMASSQFAIFAALKAKAKQDAGEHDNG